MTYPSNSRSLFDRSLVLACVPLLGLTLLGCDFSDREVGEAPSEGTESDSGKEDAGDGGGRTSSGGEGGADDDDGATPIDIDPGDPCDGVELEPCTACPADWAESCGESCTEGNESCSNHIGDGRACVDGVWECSVHAPLEPDACDLVCEEQPGTGAGCPDDACGSDAYCDRSDNACGEPVEPQWTQFRCESRPVGCGEIYAPVCACDGQVYPNQCMASAAGVDVAAAGGCEAPEGMGACGQLFCDPVNSYCQHVHSDVVGYADDYACQALPTACDAIEDGCECDASPAQGGLSCEVGEAGLLIVHFPGG